MYDDPSFLATSARTPVVRCLEVERPAQPYEMTLPLRILAVESLPKGAAALATRIERALLDGGAQDGDGPGSRPVRLAPGRHAHGRCNRQLRSQDYHILHFIGHGGFDKRRQRRRPAVRGREWPRATGQRRPTRGDRSPTRRRSGWSSSTRARAPELRSRTRSPASRPSLIERRGPGGHRDAVRDHRPRGDPVRAASSTRPCGGPRGRHRRGRGAHGDLRGQERHRVGRRPVLFMRGSDAHLFSITDAAPIERVAPPLPPKTEGGGSGGGTTRGAGRLGAWFRARPLAMPLLLAVVAILVVAVVAVVPAQQRLDRRAPPDDIPGSARAR